MNFVETLELEKNKVKCVLCEKVMPGIEEAMDNGWLPQFYVGDTEYEIACPDCFEKYLQFDVDGEVELKPEFVKIFMVSSSSKEK